MLSILALSSAGCGLTLDLQPPDEGFDASVPPGDGGAERECRADGDCDDGLFCNGVERCRAGACTPGVPPDCEDDVDCTVDRCDEQRDACVRAPDDSLCDDGAECGEGRCDAVLGCWVEPDDGDCEDSAGCTLDECVEGSCAHLPDSSACGVGEYCSEEHDCTAIPPCSVAADCPVLPCQEAQCSDGFCDYEEVSGFDPACAVFADACTPTWCEAGACAFGDPVVCDPVELTSCVAEVCRRHDTGDVSCAPKPRDGDVCLGTDACTRGTCRGDVCEITSACEPTNACFEAVCDPSGACRQEPRDCGANAGCVADGGVARCECNSGYVDCDPVSPGCECAVGGLDGGVAADASVVCPFQRADCDGDGSCECDLTSQFCGLASGVAACVDEKRCAMCAVGQQCCLCTGECVSDASDSGQCATPLGEPCPLAVTGTAP